MVVKGPQTETEIVQAMIEGLCDSHACEERIGPETIRCTLCACTAGLHNYGSGRIEHGPYCPVALARRLRDMRTTSKET